MNLRTTVSGSFAAVGTFLWGAPVAIAALKLPISLPTWLTTACVIGGLVANGLGIFFHGYFAQDAAPPTPPTAPPAPTTTKTPESGFSIFPLLVFLACLSILLLAGCAYVHSTTTRSTDPKTGVITESTVATGYTMFDGNASLAKFSNRSGYVDSTNRFAPGTYVSGLQESSSSSNLVLILPGVAGAVVQGLK